MTPLPLKLPPLSSPAWGHAKEIALALRSRGKGNPFIVSAIANSFAESWWTADAVGDHRQSFGPFQMKEQYYRAPILKGTGIDICDPKTTLDQHCEAVLFALGMHANLPTLAALEAAKTGAEATRIWAHDFERASAGGAVERRVAIAPALVVWLAKQAI